VRWLCLVPLQARRRVWVHAPTDSCLPRWLEGGSAVGPVLAVDPESPGRRISRAPRIFPGQDRAGLEAWLQTAGLRAAGITEDRKSTRLNSSHVKISYA